MEKVIALLDEKFVSARTYHYTFTSLHISGGFYLDKLHFAPHPPKQVTVAFDIKLAIPNKET